MKWLDAAGALVVALGTVWLTVRFLDPGWTSYETHVIVWLIALFWLIERRTR